MSTYIHGSFKDEKEQFITVEIKSKKNGADGQAKDYEISEDGDIKFGADPVIIEQSVDDLFEHIIKKSCQINLVTSKYLGDVLFTGNEKECSVKVWLNGDTCIFSGYVEPYTYSQSWAYRIDEFTINCIDELSCLQYEYMTDESSWQSLYEQNQILAFKDYISMILPTRTWWDKSKKVDDDYIMSRAGVSMNVFLGEGADKICTNEEILEEILKYTNLHAIQEGEDIFLFDWDTIGSDIEEWENIYDSSLTKSMSATMISVTQDLYDSDDTNLSMSEVYNQIQVKCELEDKDTIISSPLDSGSLESYSDYKHLFFSEYISEGDGSRSAAAFREIIKQGVTSPENIVYTDYANWYRNDYYFKWNHNPKWTLYWNGTNVRDWLEVDQQGNYINMWRLMKALRQNRFMPALVSVGKHEKKINNTNPTRMNSAGAVTGTISMSDYLVISVNSTYDDGYNDSKTYYDQLESDIKKAANYNASNNTATGLLQFNGESALYSPTDDETTNYLIFNGSLVMNPVRRQSAITSLTNPSYSRASSSETKMIDFYNGVTNNSLISAVPVSQNEYGGRYATQFWGNVNQGDNEIPKNNELFIYPFTNEEKAQDLKYNYSDYGDTSDKFDKVPVIECELKIGDKYLVETFEGGDKQKPLYHWYTYEQCPTEAGDKKTTFTLGIDPAIGDNIIGKEYELANTVDGRYSNEKGTAIPIKKSDALSGKLTFKILGPVNTQWNVITRRHPTLFRHTKWYDNMKTILAHVSSIWIKDFNVKIISDNKGKDVKTSESSDIVYISDEAKGYLKKKDDIEFKINTALTTDELLALGITNNTSNTNVVDMKTNLPLSDITDVYTEETDRAERLYINQYYNIYSSPKIMINTTLKKNNLHPFLHLHNFVGFGQTIPMSITYNVRECNMNITCIQKNKT